MSLRTRLRPIGLMLTLAIPGVAHGVTHSFGLELRPPGAPSDLRPSVFEQGQAAAEPEAPPQQQDASADPAPDQEVAGTVLVASADASSTEKTDASSEDKKPSDAKKSSKSGQAGSLDFDLLGTAAPQTQVDGGRLRLRRTMLTIHQGLGLALVGLQLATTVVGQLNYSDKFGGANTGKYQQPHAVLAFGDLSLFVGTGLLAILAPKPVQQQSEGFDRISLHKVAMFTAATGMATEAVLGMVTASREGYLNQKSIGTAHLVIGYVTLAAIITGVSAIVF